MRPVVSLQRTQPLPPRPPLPSRRKLAGFTLVEVLVALSVMAMMALMSWRGVDAMLRTHRQLQARADQVQALQTGLAQWQADLNQLATWPQVPAWDWDGNVLRLTRQAVLPGEGVQVVAWVWRRTGPQAGQWLRWQSPAQHTQRSWRMAWEGARVWGQNGTPDVPGSEVAIHALTGWQLYVHRGGSWSNPQSSDVVQGSPSTAGSASTGLVPDGVRLVLELAPSEALAGQVSLDWVRPTLSEGEP